MSFSAIFATGLSGVSAQAASLENISNNIANSQTTGFRRTRTDFASLIPGGSTSNSNEQTGGVTAQTRILFEEQGAITRTASETDLAISGDGFFVVSDTALDDVADQPLAFTRSGSFSVQTDGTLVNEAGFALQGAPISGAANPAVSLAGLQTINVNTIEGLAQATNEISLSGNLNASALPGTTLNQRVTTFDADGAQRDLIFNFINQGGNLWTASAAFADTPTQPLATGTLAFTAGGTIDAAASSFPQALTLAGGQNVSLDTTNLTLTDQATSFNQFASDGVAFGALSGVDISQGGVVSALFSNGLRQDIFQVAIANFTNPEGLDIGAQTTFLFNDAAGEIEIDIPQTGRAGAIESAALEISTVDIGQEFSALIETQRAYAANTQVISIADELWQTLSQTAV